MSQFINVEPIAVEGQQTYCGLVFPLVLQCRTEDADLKSVEDWIGSHRANLDQQALEHGVILFRDFPIHSDIDFDRFIQAFEYPNFPYEQSLSNAVRINRTERVFTANEAPSEVAIYLHHEMAQTPIFPSKLLFYCEQAPESGGETAICRSDVLFERMQAELPEFVAACESQGLKYTNVMPSVDDPQSGMGRSWQSTFRASTKEQAEDRMRELNYSWDWLPDGCLRTSTPVLPAVRELDENRKSFFNQLIAAYKGWKDERNDPQNAITLGDGTPLDQEDVLRCADLADDITFDVPWQTGDVAIVDNFVAMHGRRSFVGTRKVLASLVANEE